jgi:hypothetical protein
MGLVIGAFAVWLASTGIGHGPGSGGLFEVMLAGAVLLALIGLLHIRTAALIWAGSDGGRQLGLVLGVLGLIVGGVIAFAVLDSALDRADVGQPAPPAPGAPPLALPPTGAGTDLTPALVLVPYLIVVIGLVVSRRQFSGRPGTGAADYSSSSRS